MEIHKKFSPGASILFSTESEETDWRRSLDSLKASPLTKAKKSIVFGGQDETYRRVIFDIIPCVVVSSLETDAFMAFVAHIDMLTVRSNPSARSKRRYSRSSCYSEGKKKVQGCVSQNSDPMNSILQKVEALGLNASAGRTWNSQDAPGTKLNSGERRGQLGGIIHKGETHERNPCALVFEDRTFEETSRQADCTSKVAWNLAWKYEAQKPKTTTCYSHVKAPETQNIVYLSRIRELQCTMLSKRDLRSDTMDTLRRSKKNSMCDLPRPGKVKINE